MAKIAADAARDMMKFAAEFGCTPIARSRIAAGVGGQPPSPGKFDGFLSDG
jgi:phage terminase small subunit